jgi:hypothetical protein
MGARKRHGNLDVRRMMDRAELWLWGKAEQAAYKGQFAPEMAFNLWVQLPDGQRNRVASADDFDVVLALAERLQQHKKTPVGAALQIMGVGGPNAKTWRSWMKMGAASAAHRGFGQREGWIDTGGVGDPQGLEAHQVSKWTLEQERRAREQSD